MASIACTLWRRRRRRRNLISYSDGLSPTTECLQNVRLFLDREGTALSNEQEFIQYFALPHVKDPAEHPTFRALFQVTLAI